MKADLHNHTKNSDGSLSVSNLALLKKQEGFDLIAITDHDSIKGAREITKNLKIPVLLGIELSTYYKQENIHLLGYFKGNQLPSQEFQTFLHTLEEDRKKRVHKIIALLKKHGIEISDQDVEKYADGAIARPHVAKAILEKYAFTWEEIFEKYIGDDAPCYVPTKNLSLEEAIALLHKNNALAILAHPHYILKSKLEEFIPLGVDGIEVFYPTIDDKTRKKLLRFAKKHALLITGGSDFHDKDQTKRHEALYPYGIEDMYLEPFLKKLEVMIDDWK